MSACAGADGHIQRTPAHARHPDSLHRLGVVPWRLQRRLRDRPAGRIFDRRGGHRQRSRTRVSRQLDAGVYLVEVRERDIDLRVRIDAGTVHTELADAYLRHGLHRTVVRLDSAGAARASRSTASTCAAGRVPPRCASCAGRKPQPDAAPDQRLLGFEALGKGSELIAQDNTEAWRAALEPLREAARHFQAANDLQSLAEAEYQRGYVEYNLLFDFADSRRTAESALAHFRAAGDDVGAQRAAMLLALDEFGIAGGMGPEAPRAEQLRAARYRRAAHDRGAGVLRGARHAERRACTR